MLKKILALLAMLYAAASFAAVDVNKATAAELDAVKGIGPTTSKAIIDERKGVCGSTPIPSSKENIPVPMLSGTGAFPAFAARFASRRLRRPVFIAPRNRLP